MMSGVIQYWQETMNKYHTKYPIILNQKTSLIDQLEM
jgi:hypothetical protein